MHTRNRHLVRVRPGGFTACLNGPTSRGRAGHGNRKASGRENLRDRKDVAGARERFSGRFTGRAGDAGLHLHPVPVPCSISSDCAETCSAHRPDIEFLCAGRLFRPKHAARRAGVPDPGMFLSPGPRTAASPRRAKAAMGDADRAAGQFLRTKQLTDAPCAPRSPSTPNVPNKWSRQPRGEVSHVRRECGDRRTSCRQPFLQGDGATDGPRTAGWCCATTTQTTSAN